jgi:hypothetical protein
MPAVAKPERAGGFAEAGPPDIAPSKTAFVDRVLRNWMSIDQEMSA